MSLLRQLADLCRTEPTRAKWVIVPSHSLGHILAERLAREGTDWANLRFVTPLDLAVRMAGPYLVEAGIDPTDETLGPALVMRLLLALPEEGGYFRPMADQPSMAHALWRTLMELRLAGIQAASLPADAFASPAKALELQRLLEAYEHHLETTRVADAAVLFEHAPRYPDFCPIASADVRLEWPGVAWAPLVRRFIDALPGQAQVPRELLLAGGVVPPRLRALAAPTTQVDPPVRFDADRLRFLVRPASAPPRESDADGSLQIFTAGGRDAEIDEIFRRVLSSGLPLDEIEIACASEPHALLAWEKATLLAWPVTIASGVPASVTRPGRALLAWCAWIEADFAATRLRRLLHSGDIAPAVFLEGSDADGRLSPGQAGRLLLRAAATWGRAAYAPAFARLRASQATRAEDPRRDAAQRVHDAVVLRRLERLERWCDDLLEGVPLADGAGTIDVPALVEAGRDFLGRNAARTSVLDAAALVALDDSLAELRSLGAFRAPVPTALRFLRERVEQLRVGADRPRPGRLHVSRLSSARLAGRSLVFVAGLEEGRVFPAAAEDPVLLDAERAAIDPRLPCTGDRLVEAVHAVVSTLATIGTQSARGVCLSFSCRDTREFRDTFPAWLVLQAFRLLRGHTALGYGDLDEFLGEPASAIPRSPELATHEAGWWMAQARRAGAAARARVLGTFPALEHGAAALAARASNAFTAWDGFVPAAGAALDIASGEAIVSASTLESTAACPFRFFLERALRIDGLEESAPQPDVWLDHATRGRELHALFAAIMRTVRAERRRIGPADMRPAVARAARRLEELAHEIPPPSPEVHAREAEEFLRDVRLFVEEECRRTEAEPIAFEVPFGSPPEPGTGEPLALVEPIAIEIGPQRVIRLRGRIDRIDRRHDRTFETVDYKTGSYYPPRWEGTFARGTRLQHALYGAAAGHLLAARFDRPVVTRGTYYFPTARGFQHRKTIETSASALTEVLSDLAQVIASGTFVHAPETDACSFCAFVHACGRSPHEEAARKEQVAPELDAYRRLRTHD